SEGEGRERGEELDETVRRARQAMPFTDLASATRGRSSGAVPTWHQTGLIQKVQNHRKDRHDRGDSPAGYHAESNTTLRSKVSEAKAHRGSECLVSLAGPMQTDAHPQSGRGRVEKQ